MKKVSLIMAVLFCVSSFVGADVVSDLQAKRNSFHNKGISYVVELPCQDDSGTVEKCRVTEKGDNKCFETVGSAITYTPGILYSNGKIYSVPSVETQQKNTPVRIMVVQKDSVNVGGLADIDNENYVIPDYTGFVAGKKETVNGYQCQIITKTVTKKVKNTENGEKFAYFETRTDTTTMWIVEKYGYPTRIESKYQISFSNGSETVSDKTRPTVNFTDFSVDISKRPISLPKYAVVCDPNDPASMNPKRFLEMQKKIDEENEDEDDEE